MLSPIMQARRLPVVFGCLLTAMTALTWRNEAPQSVANSAWNRVFTGGADAANSFRQALLADPAFPYRWSDLGVALAAAGRKDEADYCFRRSLELGPNSPQLALRAANFHFQNSETAAALRLCSMVLRESATFDDAVFSSYVRMGGATSDVIAVGINGNRRAQEALFHFVLRADDLHRPTEIWQWMESHGLATAEQARLWSNWLRGHGYGGSAVSVWAKYVAHDPAYRVSNWIYDPGFETESSADDAFGWQITPTPDARIQSDRRTFHSGKQSLRIDFAAAGNLDFHHVVQHVWLEPGPWRLTGWIRTGSLSTDEGIGLQAADSNPTASLTGTHEWTKVSADFTVKGSSKSIDIRLVRRPSWKFDNKPKGIAWIDDVELRPMP